MFWPGDDVAILGRRPTTWTRFDDAYPHEARVDRVVEWFARPAVDRPVLGLLYFSLVDVAAHDHGPHSREALAAAAAADALVGRLVDGLARLGLGGRVNLVVVSDHGMAETSPERTIVLDDAVDLAAVDVLETGPMLRLAPRLGADGVPVTTADRLLARLARAHPRLRVYSPATLPASYHAAGSLRLPPAIGIADDGWLIVTRAERERWRAGGGAERGDHGYAPEQRSMHGLFIASGPAFRAGQRAAPFDSVHLYSLFCRVLGIAPATHDGDPAVTASLLRLDRP